MNPKISIIIPVFNKARTLERCLKSVLDQTAQDYEVIAVNDGSGDNSLEILKGYESDQVHIYSQENRGVSAARNIGISAASGDYLIFADADDELAGDAVAVFSSIIDSSHPDVIFGNAILCIDSRKNQKPGSIPEKKTLSGWGLLESCLKDEGITHHVWANCYRKKFLSDTVFDESMSTHEDEYFNVCCGMKKPECIVLPDIVYFYYKNMDGISRSEVSPRKIQDMLGGAEKVRNLVALNCPEYHALAENYAVKSNMAVLAICPDSATVRSCIRDVQQNRSFFISDSRMDRILFFLIIHHLYWVYQMAFSLKFRR